MLVGDLVAGSFEQTPQGWTAFYKDGPFFAKVERKGDHIWLSEGFSEVEKSTVVFPIAAKGSEFIRAYFRNVGIYDDTLKNYFKEINLTCVPYQSEESAGISCTFPDATHCTLVVALPFSQRCFESLQGFAKELAAAHIPASGCLKTGMSVINYLEDKCPEVPTNPVLHLEWMLSQGFLPAAMPAWEGNPGSKAFTSRRISPILHLSVAQAYLPRTVSLLTHWGLLLKAESKVRDRMGFLMHGMDAALATSTSNFTTDESRRVFLPLREEEKGPQEALADLGGEPLSEEAFGQKLEESLAEFETTRDQTLAKILHLLEEAPKHHE
jgi:hypothetical protein